MKTDQLEIRTTDPVNSALGELRQVEREARALRVEFAHDRLVRLIVGLDLLIRRAAYRFIAAAHGHVQHDPTAFHVPHGDRPR